MPVLRPWRVNDPRRLRPTIGYAARCRAALVVRPRMRDEQPISALVVDRDTNDQWRRCPKRVDWGRCCRGRSGTLNVVIGHSKAGPVEWSPHYGRPTRACRFRQVGGVARLARLHRAAIRPHACISSS